MHDQSDLKVQLSLVNCYASKSPQVYCSGFVNNCIGDDTKADACRSPKCNRKTNKKLCCRKEATRCYVSEYLQYKAHSFIISCFGFRYTLRTIKVFSVLFSLANSSMLQAVTNKHSLVSRRLCDLHCMVVGVFVTS